MAGDWKELAERYGVDQEPEGVRFTKKSVQVGEGFFAPIYKNCTTISVSKKGLYLAVTSVLGSIGGRQVLIPWKDIAKVEKTRLYWQDAARLLIGTSQITSITVMMDVFNSAAPYLNPSTLGEPFGQHSVQPGATILNKYCANCGTRAISIQKFCAECGTELTEHSRCTASERFCHASPCRAQYTMKY